VQELQMTSDRRVEAAKDHFQNSIKKGHNREQRLRAQVESLQAEIEVYKQRVNDATNSSEVQKERLENRIHALEVENRKLHEELGLSRTQQIANFEHSLEIEHQKSVSQYVKL
jgi:chaperonin cofactor prefoldin